MLESRKQIKYQFNYQNQTQNQECRCGGSWMVPSEEHVTLGCGSEPQAKFGLSLGIEII